MWQNQFPMPVFLMALAVMTSLYLWEVLAPAQGLNSLISGMPLSEEKSAGMHLLLKPAFVPPEFTSWW